MRWAQVGGRGQCQYATGRSKSCAQPGPRAKAFGHAPMHAAALPAKIAEVPIWHMRSGLALERRARCHIKMVAGGGQQRLIIDANSSEPLSRLALTGLTLVDSRAEAKLRGIDGSRQGLAVGRR